jgi:hypothetical protein
VVFFLTTKGTKKNKRHKKNVGRCNHKKTKQSGCVGVGTSKKTKKNVVERWNHKRNKENKRHKKNVIESRNHKRNKEKEKTKKKMLLRDGTTKKQSKVDVLGF